MGFLDILRKKSLGERKLNAAKQDIRVNRVVDQLGKSQAEREVERYQKEEREQRLKDVLEYYRRKEAMEDRGKNILNAKNIFKDDQPRVLTSRNTLIKDPWAKSPYFN